MEKSRGAEDQVDQEYTALSRLSFRGFRRLLVAPAHELVQGEGDFVGMQRAPDDDALELDGIVGDAADFHQLGFDDLRVSHAFLALHTSAPLTHSLGWHSLPPRSLQFAVCRLRSSISKASPVIGVSASRRPWSRAASQG
jgi:hypothetical protein